MSFPYSNIAFCQLLKGKNAQCLIQAMKNIFEFIGGVPHEITFDNEGGLVKCLGEKITKRIENELFLRFKNHYDFRLEYCRSKSPNQKGHVEGKVGYNKVLFYDMDNNMIAEFDRLYGDKTFTAIHWEKWLPTISRRPNSLFHSSLTDMFTQRLRDFLLNGTAKLRGIYMKALCEMINAMPLDRAMCGGYCRRTGDRGI